MTFVTRAGDWVSLPGIQSSHLHQPAFMVKNTKSQSIFYKDAPLHKVTREDVWPPSTPLTTRLYGCKQKLEKTTSIISRAALIGVAYERREEEEAPRDPRWSHNSSTVSASGAADPGAVPTGIVHGQVIPVTRNRYSSSYPDRRLAMSGQC